MKNARKTGRKLKKTPCFRMKKAQNAFKNIGLFDAFYRDFEAKRVKNPVFRPETTVKSHPKRTKTRPFWVIKVL